VQVQGERTAAVPVVCQASCVGQIFAAERTVPGYSIPNEQPFFYCRWDLDVHPGNGIGLQLPVRLALMFAMTSSSWLGPGRSVGDAGEQRPRNSADGCVL